MLFQFVIRNLRRHPLLNFIKVLGLALGLSGILFITLFLKNELTYDSFHTNADRIYRFTVTDPAFFGNNHFARIINSEDIPALAAHFPEIESYVRLSEIRGGLLKHGEQFYSIKEGFECDSTFFQVFNAELLVGDKTSVLETPASMVISESFARKVFGTGDPIGQTISLPAGQYYGVQSDYSVKGVMKDFPQNSHFHPEVVATPANGPIQWWAYTYLLLRKNANAENITNGYMQFLEKQSGDPNVKIETKAHLQKITDIHLQSDKLREIEANGNTTNIYVLSIAALILLLISMSNYASLNLGMAGFNNKFIIINRILGSARFINLKYFAGESLLIVVGSILLAALIAFPANSFILGHFGLNLFKANTLLIIAVFVIFSLLGILSGLQPVIKQTIGKIYRPDRSLVKPNKIAVSRGIIITQYTFAIILITAVIVISRQTNFALNQSMGSNQNNILCFESVHANVQQKFETFKAELLKNSSIESVSAMLEPPGGEANDMFRFEMEGINPAGNEKNMIGVFPCDYSFAGLFGLNFLAGNNFSEKNTDADGSGEYLINETAMNYLGYQNASEIIGKTFRLISSSPEITIPAGKITGVVKDFHLSTLKKKVAPLVMFKRDKIWLINFLVSYKPGQHETALAGIQKVWDDLFPTYPLSYEQVDTMYRKVYKTELLQAKLLSIFTLISILISSMGLLGISLLVAQQRVKEIGIRKVNGATVSEILSMLNKNFVAWVAVAFVVATPVAWFAMNKWLENFAYKTSLSWWIFALAGLLALGIALLTVSWQSWRAATRNPVEALRYE